MYSYRMNKIVDQVCLHLLDICLTYILYYSFMTYEIINLALWFYYLPNSYNKIWNKVTYILNVITKIKRTDTYRNLVKQCYGFSTDYKNIKIIDYFMAVIAAVKRTYTYILIIKHLKAITKSLL